MHATGLDMMGAPSQREVRHDQDLYRVRGILRDATSRARAGEVLLASVPMADGEVRRDAVSADRTDVRCLRFGVHVAFAFCDAGEVLFTEVSREALECHHGAASAPTMDAGTTILRALRNGIHADTTPATVVFAPVPLSWSAGDGRCASSRGKNMHRMRSHVYVERLRWPTAEVLLAPLCGARGLSDDTSHSTRRREGTEYPSRDPGSRVGAGRPSLRTLPRHAESVRYPSPRLELSEQRGHEPHRAVQLLPHGDERAVQRGGRHTRPHVITMAVVPARIRDLSSAVGSRAVAA